MKKHIFLLLFGAALFSAALQAQPKLKFVDFATGLNGPLDIAHAGDSRLFVVEQRGRIQVLDSLGVKSPEPFLNIESRVQDGANEQGLLGLAFHPNYAQNGWFYVYYNRIATGAFDGDERVSRFTRDSLNPNKADPNSEKVLLDIEDPAWNHNGGCLKFGPDGFLYIATGDGGGAGDTYGNGQKKNTLLSKILRIDVDGGDPYAVPADNPFANDPAFVPETWHWGLRNPWRFSFDRLTGDLWIGDVGQNAWEEVDFAAAGVSGLNYGWPCREGNHSYSNCSNPPVFTGAAFEYPHSGTTVPTGCSITGGFVYRGEKYPDLQGKYLVTDYCSGRWWAVTRNVDGTFSNQLLGNFEDYQFSGLGEDAKGELYVAFLTSGKIARVTELCSAFQMSSEVVTPAVCDESFSGILALHFGGNSQPTDILWSDGKTDSLNVYLNPGTYTVVATDANNCQRRDTLTIESLSPPPPAMLGINAIVCEGESQQFSCPEAPAGYTYQWYKDGVAIVGATAQTYLATEAGQYTVRYEGFGCNSLPSAVQGLSFVPAPMPTISISGDTLWASETGFSVQWLLNGNPIAGATEPFWVPNSTGNYSVEIGNGYCTGLSPAVFFEFVATRLPEAVQQFLLSPNPTNHSATATLVLKTAHSVKFNLCDANDKALQSVLVSGKNIQQDFDLSLLPAGAYFLKIEIDGHVFVRTLIKQ